MPEKSKNDTETMDMLLAILGLEGDGLFISDSSTNGSEKSIIIETKPIPHYCPCCNFKMHSRGKKKRTINHPIMQDHYHVTIILLQRRWKCTNPDCGYDIAEQFHFVNKNRRTTNLTEMMIVAAYRNLSFTTASIASKYNVSSSYAQDVFNRYVKLDRLNLTDAISVDEVHIDMDKNCLYALVIQDFHTGDTIDILQSRRTNITEPYFVSLPIEEKNAVKYLISDMYNPYISYVNKYFPNAVSVVDSFHVLQWINRELEQYIRNLIKKYRQRDREKEERLSLEKGKEVKLPVSKEVYLLQNYRWLILMNQSKIKYRNEPLRDKKLNCLMNTYDYEDSLFAIDPNLRVLRDLKELYVDFNASNAGFPLQAKSELELLIERYRQCEYDMFRRFAALLETYKEPIINSFIMVEKIGNKGRYKSRLSNGPIESLNRKVKDLKRNGRGYRNFEHFRNRFLYATRRTPVLNGVSDYNPVKYMEE